METKHWLMLGGFALAAYYLYTKVSAVTAVVGAGYDAARGGVADALYSAFGPQVIGTDYYYTVNFSNGRHAIPKQSPDNKDGVDSAGRFTYKGAKFVIRDKKNPATGAVEHWAFAA